MQVGDDQYNSVKYTLLNCDEDDAELRLIQNFDSPFKAHANYFQQTATQDQNLWAITDWSNQNAVLQAKQKGALAQRGAHQKKLNHSALFACSRRQQADALEQQHQPAARQQRIRINARHPSDPEGGGLPSQRSRDRSQPRNLVPEQEGAQLLDTSLKLTAQHLIDYYAHYAPKHSARGYENLNTHLQKMFKVKKNPRTPKILDSKFLSANAQRGQPPPPQGALQ